MTDHRPLHALLVEDDPVSAAFLEAALARVPLHAVVAHDCAAARGHAANHAFDLWLIDANLPDGRGDALLGEFRSAGLATPAIAHTAARDVEEHERLLGAGFLEVLVKPLSVSEVVAAVGVALGLAAPSAEASAQDASLPLWDDAGALHAMMGDRSHLAALRGLFRPELAMVRANVAEAVERGDRDALRGHLHRLRASCGFVGAARLGDAARRMADGDSVQGWPAFDRVLGDTADAFPVD